jgi:excisionase family DNA binding protein
MSRSHVPETFRIIIEATAAATAAATADAILERLRTQHNAASNSAGSPLLSVRETCAYVKLSRSQLHRLEHAGVLTPTRLRRRVFYARAALDEFIRTGGGP